MLSNCKVGAIVFLVSDLGRTLAFYRDTLGLPVNQVAGHDGPYALGQVGDVVLVFIVQKTAKAGDTPVVVFGLDGAIDDYADELVRKGVEIVVPVTETPDGGLSVDFLDPDRNGLSLYQSVGRPRRK